MVLLRGRTVRADKAVKPELLADLGSIKRHPRSVRPVRTDSFELRRSFDRTASDSCFPKRSVDTRVVPVIEAVRQPSERIFDVIWDLPQRFPFAVDEFGIRALAVIAGWK